MSGIYWYGDGFGVGQVGQGELIHVPDESVLDSFVCDAASVEAAQLARPLLVLPPREEFGHVPRRRTAGAAPRPQAPRKRM